MRLTGCVLRQRPIGAVEAERESGSIRVLKKKHPAYVSGAGADVDPSGKIR
jgi:hypothetical protein